MRRWPFTWSESLLITTYPLAVVWVILIVQGSIAYDWNLFAEAGRRVHTGDLYAVTDTYAFRYSPIFAYAFGPLSVLGPWAWRGLIVAAGLLLPNRWMRLAVMVSWPFWFDVQHGGTVSIALLLAAWALRGSRWASLGYLAMVQLIPRPLFLPVAAWLLWRDRTLWRPMLAMVAVHAAAVLISGWGPDWVARVAGSVAEVESFWNLAPSRFIGAWWLILAVPLAAWLWFRGRLGLASLLASPYWLPYYLSFVALEPRLAPPKQREAGEQDGEAVGPEDR